MGPRMTRINTNINLCVLCASVRNLFFIICSLLIVNCSNDSGIPQGKGAFTLNIAGLQRTILLKENLTLSKVQSYKLEFDCTSDAAQSFTENISSSNINSAIYIDKGDYSLTVTAYLLAGQQNAVAQGSVSFSIDEGESITRSITLTVLQNGEGTFSWDITYPSGLSSGKMEVIPQAGGINTDVTFLMGTTNDTSTGIPLASGYYSVLVTLSKTGASDIERREILHIYNYMTSHYEYTFLDAHFNMNIYTVTFDFNGADGVSGTMQQSVFHGELLQKPADPKKAGYAFKGWFIDPVFSGSEYPFTAPVIGDFNLYAKWVPAGNLGIGTEIQKDPVVLINNATLLADNTITILKADNGSITPNPVTLTVDNLDDYTIGSITWRFGTQIESLTYTIDETSDIVATLGTKILTVTAVSDGVPYSTTVFVLVKEPPGP